MHVSLNIVNVIETRIWWNEHVARTGGMWKFIHLDQSLKGRDHGGKKGEDDKTIKMTVRLCMYWIQQDGGEIFYLTIKPTRSLLYSQQPPMDSTHRISLRHIWSSSFLRWSFPSRLFYSNVASKTLRISPVLHECYIGLGLIRKSQSPWFGHSILAPAPTSNSSFHQNCIIVHLYMVEMWLVPFPGKGDHRLTCRIPLVATILNAAYLKNVTRRYFTFLVCYRRIEALNSFCLLLMPLCCTD